MAHGDWERVLSRGQLATAETCTSDALQVHSARAVSQHAAHTLLCVKLKQQTSPMSSTVVTPTVGL